MTWDLKDSSGNKVSTGLYRFTVVAENSDGVKTYSHTYFNVEKVQRYGIDVSRWQGNINWDIVKSAGIEFAMIKCSEGSSYVDPFFYQNIQGAKNAGIKVGVYHFARGTNTAEATVEAQHALSVIGGWQLEYPVAYDVEADELWSLSRTEVTDNIIAFCETVKAAGYTPMIYTNLNWFTNKIDYDLSLIHILILLEEKLFHGFWGYSIFKFQKNSGITLCSL